MLKLVAALLSVPAALLGVVAGTGVLVVDVRESGPGGHHLVLPVPLIAIRAAASLAPAEKLHLDLGELRELKPSLAGAEQVLKALADAPDGELLRVEEPREQVVIVKAGDVLQVRVHGGDDQDLEVNVPLRMVVALLGHAQAGRIEPGDVARALSEARLTDLVDVRDGNDRIRVYVW